jgi:hypothetical protein
MFVGHENLCQQHESRETGLVVRDCVYLQLQQLFSRSVRNIGVTYVQCHQGILEGNLILIVHVVEHRKTLVALIYNYVFYFYIIILHPYS